jgi:hypothetical protein
MNQNAGKKPLIPINTAAAASTATLAPSPVDKMTAQAQESAKTASFASSSAPSARHVGQGRGRRQSTSQKTIMKGVYFEPAVYSALIEMQDKGQNISKFINRLVRQSLTI